MHQPFVLQEGRFYRLEKPRILLAAERTEHGWGEHEVLAGAIFRCLGPAVRRVLPDHGNFVPIRARTSTGAIVDLLLRVSKQGVGPAGIELIDPLTALADCGEVGQL